MTELNKPNRSQLKVQSAACTNRMEMLGDGASVFNLQTGGLLARILRSSDLPLLLGNYVKLGSLCHAMASALSARHLEPMGQAEGQA